MVTLTRGDIVRLRSDEQEAERCESESTREYHRSRRYIVLGRLPNEPRFRMPDGVEIAREHVYEIWPAVTCAPWIEPRRVFLSDLIATCERAEEIA